MEEAAVKGLIFRGVKKWIIDRWGDNGFESFVAALPDSDRATWTTALVLPITMVPAASYRHMHEAIESVFGTGDGQVFKEAAAAVAFEDLGNVMKLLMKVGSPAFVAGRFPIAWKRYFNRGVMVLHNQQPKSLEAVLENAGVYGEAGCLGTWGWTAKALTYAGAKDLEAEHPECRFKSGSRCLFTYKWR